jgi:hypothetical protein
MACPNFKNGPKNGLHPLGVNVHHNPLTTLDQKRSFMRCSK